jgi:hypothetical protein
LSIRAKLFEAETTEEINRRGLPMKIAAVPVLVLFTAMTSHAQPASRAVDATRTEALIPLFVSCDLSEQFTTPSLDQRDLLWLETPVSREGARFHEEARKRVDVSRVPLVLQAHSLRMHHSPAAPFSAQERPGTGHIQLMASEDHGFYEPAKDDIMPARTRSSTWVRIRALYGP